MRSKLHNTNGELHCSFSRENLHPKLKINELQKCYLCNALHTSYANKCTKCSGNFELRKQKIVLTKNRPISATEIEHFLSNVAEKLFFDTYKNYSQEELPSNSVEILISKLKDKKVDYAALLTLRMIGFEVWSSTDDDTYFVRNPNSLEFHKI